MGIGTLRRHRGVRGLEDEADNPHVEAGAPTTAGKDVKVADLEAHLARVHDAELVASWAKADKRKTAGPVYETRLEELAEAAEDGDEGAEDGDEAEGGGEE